MSVSQQKRKEKTLRALLAQRTAIDVAQAQCAKWWELRAATLLARLWLDRRKDTKARDLLAPICDWFAEGFDTPTLKEAKALLDELR